MVSAQSGHTLPGTVSLLFLSVTIQVFVTIQITPRMMSVSAHAKRIKAIPIPSPIAVPALHASANSPLQLLSSEVENIAATSR